MICELMITEGNKQKKAGPFLTLPHFLRINYYREKQLDSRPSASVVASSWQESSWFAQPAVNVVICCLQCVSEFARILFTCSARSKSMAGTFNVC